MHYIITTNPNGSCLSSLGSISKNSQNYRNIYSVETFSCSRLHAKSKKSRFSKNFNQFRSSVPQTESPFAKKIKQKKKKQKKKCRSDISVRSSLRLSLCVRKKNWVGSQCFGVSFSAFRIIPQNISCPHRRSDSLYELYQHRESKKELP